MKKTPRGRLISFPTKKRKENRIQLEGLRLRTKNVRVPTISKASQFQKADKGIFSVVPKYYGATPARVVAYFAETPSYLVGWKGNLGKEVEYKEKNLLLGRRRQFMILSQRFPKQFCIFLIDF